MRTKTLYAYCPACGYENACLTDRKYRRKMQSENWCRLVWRCEECGKQFESEIQWIDASFEHWCAFWLYDYRFNWKIPGIAVLACALTVALAVHFDSYVPTWFQALIMPAVFIGTGAGILLLAEIPFAYPVYIVNDRKGHRGRP